MGKETEVFVDSVIELAIAVLVVACDARMSSLRGIELRVVDGVPDGVCCWV